MKKLIAKFLFILSVGFSGFLLYAVDKIWGKSIEWDKIRSLKLGELLAKDFPVKTYQLILFPLIVVSIYYLAKRFLNRDGYTSKQRKLMQYNQMSDSANGLLFKWRVNFDYYSDIPYAADLTAFCTKHSSTPLRFIGTRCPDQSCTNYRQGINNYMVKNLVESELIERWDRINNK